MKTDRFADIDFFEFSFLVEACIPPRPIARTMFWHRVIDRYYKLLSVDERNRLYEWIKKNPCFNLEDKDCLLFENRFNPNNQYIVKTNYNGKIETTSCFLHEGKYCTKKDTYIAPEYILKITKHTIPASHEQRA